MKLLEATKKLIYLQVMLGILTYGLADADATVGVIALVFAGLSWFVVEAPGGKPMPRWFVNGGAMVAVAGVLFAWGVMNVPVIIAIGYLMVWLQVFLLYGDKSNRDWQSLIVLSLVLTICSAIIGAEMLFGIMLLLYLVAALFAILAFQLKLGHDEVQRINRAQAPRQSQVAGAGVPVTAHYQRHFTRLAIVSGVAAVGFGAVFFALIPRGQGAGLLQEWNSSSVSQITGYTSTVTLAGGARLSNSNAPVLNVAFYRNGQAIGGAGESFLLRGTALDEYDAASRRWRRSLQAEQTDREVPIRSDAMTDLAPDGFDESQLLTQAVTMRSQPEDAIFSAAAPVQIDIGEDIYFSYVDQSLRTQDLSDGTVQYVVQSAPTLSGDVVERYTQRWHSGARVRPRRPGEGRYRWSDYARTPIDTTERVRELTEQLMAQEQITRDVEAELTQDDARIAQLVERHLQREFTYSLDLPPVDSYDDPIDAFLFEYQLGHCEFFASAMCAMLRSVGIRSRVVSGFLATEFNAVGGYYVVRGRNAHAWVEVWLGDELGWRTFDPSPQADLADLHRAETSLFGMLRELYDYIEFQWIRRIISYDAIQQRQLIARMENLGKMLASQVDAWTAGLRDRLEAFRRAWSEGPGGYAMLAVAIVLAGTGGFMVVSSLARQRRLWRILRLRGIGWRERRRLAHQLAFYFRAVELVEREGHVRPTWQPPGAFAEDLAERAGQRYEPFVALTRLFYEVRFGGRDLDDDRRAEAERELERLRQTLRESEAEPVAA